MGVKKPCLVTRGSRFPRNAPGGSPSVFWVFPHEYAGKFSLAFSVVILVFLLVFSLVLLVVLL